MKPIILFTLFVFTQICWGQEPILTDKEYQHPNPEKTFPTQKSLLQDEVSLLSAEQQKELKTKFEAYQQKTNRRVYLLLIDAIGPYSNLIDYTNDLSQFWNLEPDGKDHVLIVLSLGARDVRISSSSQNLETLSLEFLNSVIQDTMIPHFNQGEFYQGMDQAVQKIMEKW